MGRYAYMVIPVTARFKNVPDCQGYGLYAGISLVMDTVDNPVR